MAAIAGAVPAGALEDADAESGAPLGASTAGSAGSNSSEARLEERGESVAEVATDAGDASAEAPSGTPSPSVVSTVGRLRLRDAEPAARGAGGPSLAGRTERRTPGRAIPSRDEDADDVWVAEANEEAEEEAAEEEEDEDAVAELASAEAAVPWLRAATAWVESAERTDCSPSEPESERAGLGARPSSSAGDEERDETGVGRRRTRGAGALSGAAAHVGVPEAGVTTPAGEYAAPTLGGPDGGLAAAGVSRAALVSTVRDSSGRRTKAPLPPFPPPPPSPPLCAPVAVGIARGVVDSLGLRGPPLRARVAPSAAAPRPLSSPALPRARRLLARLELM